MLLTIYFLNYINTYNFNYFVLFLFYFYLVVIVLRTNVCIGHWGNNSLTVFRHNTSKTIILMINRVKVSILTFYESCLTQNVGNVKISRNKRPEENMENKIKLVITASVDYILTLLLVLQEANRWI